MRKADWLAALLLMSLGIVCMTVSAISFLDRPSASFARTFLTICFWLGIPLLVVGSVYFFIRRGLERKRKLNRTRN